MFKVLVKSKWILSRRSWPQYITLISHILYYWDHQRIYELVEGVGGEAVPASSEAFIFCVVWVSYHLLMLFSIVIQERAHSSCERALRDDDVIHTSLTLMSDLLPLPSKFLLSWPLARKKLLCRLKMLSIRLPFPSSPRKGHILKFLVKITVICAQTFPLVFNWWNY